MKVITDCPHAASQHSKKKHKPVTIATLPADEIMELLAANELEMVPKSLTWKAGDKYPTILVQRKGSHASE